MPTLCYTVLGMVNNAEQFNDALAATARAEMSRRGWSVDQLLEHMQKVVVSRRTLFRLIDLETPPDRKTPLWRASYISAVAAAFGMTVSEFVAEVERQSVPSGPGKGRVAPDTSVGQSGSDVRALITRYLDNPDEDPRLRSLLADVAGHPGVGVDEAKRLDAMIRRTRRRELEQALAALPPDAERQAK